MYILKLIYSEKATKLFEISSLLLKVEISQIFVASSEYMNFKKRIGIRPVRIHLF